MFVIALMFSVAMTLTADQGDQVLIESDTSLHEKKLQRSEWKGNVVVKQTVYIMRSEYLEANYNDKNEIVQLTAKGFPVRITDLKSGGTLLVEGETIIYDSNTEVASSSRKARDRNKNSQIKADTILYRFVQKALETKDGENHKVRIDANL